MPFLLHTVLTRNTGIDDSIPLIMWTAIEGNLLVIAACVPTLHPVYDKAYTQIMRCLGLVTSDPDPNSQDNGDRGPRMGFWSEKLHAIFDSITSSVHSRHMTARTQNGPDPTEVDLMEFHQEALTRCLEDAAGITRPGNTLLKNATIVTVGTPSQYGMRNGTA